MNRELFFTLQVAVDGEIEQGRELEDIVEILAEHGYRTVRKLGMASLSYQEDAYGIRPMHQEKRIYDAYLQGLVGKVPVREPDMEKIYEAMDAGERLEEVVGKLQVDYRTLKRKHDQWQEEQLKKTGRKRALGMPGSNRKSIDDIDINMEQIYERIDNGEKAGKVAEDLGIPSRTLYTWHDKFQKEHPESRYAKRATLAGCGKRNSRPQKNIDMEWVYDRLMEGKKISEVAQSLHTSNKTLLAYHERYQEALKEGSGKEIYARKRLIDFKEG